MTLPAQNLLLEELAGRESKNIRNACELVELKLGDVLSEPGERIRNVYFPTRSVVSLVAKVTGNATLEVAIVGNEGMVGLPVVLGADVEPLLTLVQSSGEAWRMKTESFKQMTGKDAALRRALNRYAFVRLAQLAQNTACTKTHAAEARLARRLLTLQDKSNSLQFNSTQDSLAAMLGVRRSTVTLLAIPLQRKEIIRYHRGVVTILDRKALEALSCECYWSTPDRRVLDSI